MANGPSTVVSGNVTVMHDRHAPAYSGTGKLEEHLAPSGANKNPAITSESMDQYMEQMPDFSDCSTSMTPAQPSGTYFLSSDTVLLSSQDSQHSSVMGTVKHEVEINCTAVGKTSAISDKTRSTLGEEFMAPIWIL